MAVDKAAVWPASVLTVFTAFKEHFFPFSLFVVRQFCFCSVLHLVSSSPQVSFDSSGSECLDYSSPTRPSPWASVLLSTVPLKLGETGKSGRTSALNIYNLGGSRGVQAKTRLFKHFHIEKYMIVYPKKSYYCPFYGPELKRSQSYLNTLFTSVPAGRLVRAVSLCWPEIRSRYLIHRLSSSCTQFVCIGFHLTNRYISNTAEVANLSYSNDARYRASSAWNAALGLPSWKIGRCSCSSQRETAGALSEIVHDWQTVHSPSVLWMSRDKYFTLYSEILAYLTVHHKRHK